MYADLHYRRILTVLAQFGNFDESHRYQLDYLRTCVGIADGAYMSYGIHYLLHTLDSTSYNDVLYYLEINECDLAVLGECPVFADTVGDALSDVFESLAL